MKFFTICLCLFFLVACSKATEITTSKQKRPQAEDQSSDTNLNREMDEIRKSLKSEVRIKLKKDVKGGYGWEIAGKDAHEVLKANETLRKRLDN